MAAETLAPWISLAVGGLAKDNLRVRSFGVGLVGIVRVSVKK